MRLDRDGEIINDDFHGYGGFTIDDPETVAEMLEHLRNTPHQRVMRIRVPLEQVDEFRSNMPETETIVGAIQLDDIPETIPLVSGSFIAIREGDIGVRSWTEYVVERVAQQSGSSYQFEILGVFGGAVYDIDAEAKENSRQVLIEHLNENQKVDFIHHESFAVIGSESGKYYEITPRDGYSIKLVPEEIFMCATTNKQVPIYDEMLINKLYLETDEYGFVKKCNFKDPGEAEKLYQAIGLKQKPSWRQFLPF